ncbi:hypothetical protein PanWU01x14_290650 [Parasponia andersonii]|uniref:Secreted protein n=1 Tax=Parasponia andersonii TaxID=3476 RepID=A0A2P5AXS1_PARAD|nr:hypothetical protein PanWU01x14_290650 [Parasponia andersonii]
MRMVKVNLSGLHLFSSISATIMFASSTFPALHNPSTTGLYIKGFDTRLLRFNCLRKSRASCSLLSLHRAWIRTEKVYPFGATFLAFISRQSFKPRFSCPDRQ